MANDIIVSEMTSATQINTNDLMIMTQPDPQAETGYSTKKGTVLQVANKMLKGTEYLTDLPDFTDKTVLGGLEELKGDLTALLPVDTASGAIATFDTDLSMPLVDCKVNVTATQASGTPTPSTPLPITGYTGVNLRSCNKNFYNKTQNHIEPYSDIIPTAAWSTPFMLPIGTFTHSCSTGYGTCYINLYPTMQDALDNTNRISQQTFHNGSSRTQTYSSIVYCRIQQNATPGTQEGYVNVENSWQIEEGSSVTTHVDGNGTTYAVSWQDEAGTVYGGNIDLTSGVLTVTWGGADMSTLPWYYNNSYAYPFFHCGVPNDNIHVEYNVSSIKCSCYEAVSGKSSSNFRDNNYNLKIAPIYGQSTTHRVAVQDSNYTDATVFKNSLMGQYLIYELATPVTYQLTPVQVQALLGVNNVFNDTNGDTEVKYKEGIQHYIDKKIAATQALIL